MNNFMVRDKIALATGSNRGIGEAYVLKLLAAGAKKIYATARDINSLNALVAKKSAVIEPLLMYGMFLNHPQQLEKAFAEMLGSE